MHQTQFSPATLAEFYRFALLLTGNAEASERIVADTLSDSDAQLGEIRGDRRRVASFASRVRQRCLKDFSPADSDAAVEAIPPAVRRVAALQEPERSAIALFYLDLLSSEEIATVLRMSLDELAAALGRARELLSENMEARA